MVAVVDQGIDIQAQDGPQAAAEHMARCGVPRKVIERVLSPFGARRMTFPD